MNLAKILTEYNSLLTEDNFHNAVKAMITDYKRSGKYCKEYTVILSDTTFKILIYTTAIAVMQNEKTVAILNIQGVSLEKFFTNDAFLFIVELQKAYEKRIANVK